MCEVNAVIPFFVKMEKRTSLGLKIIKNMLLFYYIVNDLSFNYLSLIGFIIMMIAVGFEYIARKITMSPFS